ncbi:MAG: hypothetical protein FJZ62_05925 [Chlamydiae bacterium]|nr:hypothetical protein [Chlamydiota bacterium]
MVDIIQFIIERLIAKFGKFAVWTLLVFAGLIICFLGAPIIGKFFTVVEDILSSPLAFLIIWYFFLVFHCLSSLGSTMERAVSKLSEIKSDTEKAVYVLSKIKSDTEKTVSDLWGIKSSVSNLYEIHEDLSEIKRYMDERSYEDDEPSTFFDADGDKK